MPASIIIGVIKRDARSFRLEFGSYGESSCRDPRKGEPEEPQESSAPVLLP